MSCAFRSTLLLNSIALLAMAAPGMHAQTYKVVGEYKLPGSSAAGIAIDTAGRRLFIAGDEGISVLNVDTGKRLGIIPLKGATDVLLVPVKNNLDTTSPTLGFAASDGKAISFSLADLKAQSSSTLPAGGASSLCYSVDANTVEAVSVGGSIATIDAASGKVLHSSQLKTGAGQIACGTLDRVYVADTEANVIHVLNHETGKNEGDYPMMTGHEPSGLALDTKGRRLFVACRDGVIEVIDTDSGFTFIQLKGGTGPARGTFAWTPQGKGQWKAAAFIAQQDGTLTAVRMNAYVNYTVGGQYKLSSGLDGIAYDGQTHRLFLTATHLGVPVVVVAGY